MPLCENVFQVELVHDLNFLTRDGCLMNGKGKLNRSTGLTRILLSLSLTPRPTYNISWETIEAYSSNKVSALFHKTGSATRMTLMIL